MLVSDTWPVPACPGTALLLPWAPSTRAAPLLPRKYSSSGRGGTRAGCGKVRGLSTALAAPGGVHTLPLTSSFTPWTDADSYDELVSVQTSWDAIPASDASVVADLGRPRSTTAVLLPGRISTWRGMAAGGNADSTAPASHPCGGISRARTRSTAGSPESTGTKTGLGTRSLPAGSR